MTPDTTALEAELRAMLERATPGEWYTCGLPWFRDASGVLAGSPDPHVAPLIVDCEAFSSEREEWRNDHPDIPLAEADDDARFITAAHNAMPALLTALAEQRREIERMQERLECNHAFRLVDGKMQRVEVEPGSIPDGIECRDETIRLQDRRIKELQAEIARLRAPDAAGKPAEDVWAIAAELAEHSRRLWYALTAPDITPKETMRIAKTVEAIDDAIASGNPDAMKAALAKLRDAGQ